MRVKTGNIRRKRHKKVLKLTKGYRMTKSKLYKVANEAMLHAGQYAFIGRKLRKRNFRRLWIQRINAGLRQHEIKYSRFINLAKKANVQLDRKTLSYLATEDTNAFKAVVDKVKEAR